ncbi:hypothetical protein FML32_26360 [Klebsiella oxytoca]|uniref:hypothetical protein n=1 Tax=Klebsiella oxytoca TaxID=571 RepID=UPI001CCBD5B0|nr:hypothetical protein [Klebsiella oxytoca]MBZ7713390.1 hypothetical protein [Klebsiella oxytoca]
MPIPVARLNSLWRELGIIAVIEEKGILTTREPFIHFPTGTPVFDIWAWFEAGNEDFVVARELYGLNTH